MKRLLFVISLSILSQNFVISAKDGWSTVSKEDVEIQQILFKVAAIKENFTALGAGNSSACYIQIFNYLKSLNSKVSFEVLKQLVTNGTLPKHYLDKV